MATQYNVTNPAFTDKAAMMEYSGAMSTKTTESMLHGVECDPTKLSDPGHYVRSAPVPQGQDTSQYDHATLNIAVANSPSGYANQVLGELWVSYTVKLKVPKFYTGRGMGVQKDIFVSGNGTETAPSLFGTQAALLSGQHNSIGSTLDLSTASDITVKFPPAYTGFVEIIIAFETMTSTATVRTVNPIMMGNVRAVKDLYAAGASGVGDSPDYYIETRGAIASSGRYIGIFHCEVKSQTGGTQNSITFRFDTATITVAPSQSSLTVTEYNPGFSSLALGTGFSDAPVLVDPTGMVVVPS